MNNPMVMLLERRKDFIISSDGLSDSEVFLLTLQNYDNSEEEQARKSSEDAQAAGYTRLEKVWAG